MVELRRRFPGIIDNENARRCVRFDCGLATAAFPAAEKNPNMSDQIIDAVMARSIQTNAVRTHPLPAWMNVREAIDYPGDLMARLVTDVTDVPISASAARTVSRITAVQASRIRM